MRKISLGKQQRWAGSEPGSAWSQVFALPGSEKPWMYTEPAVMEKTQRSLWEEITCYFLGKDICSSQSGVVNDPLAWLKSVCQTWRHPPSAGDRHRLWGLLPAQSCFCSTVTPAHLLHSGQEMGKPTLTPRHGCHLRDTLKYWTTQFLCSSHLHPLHQCSRKGHVCLLTLLLHAAFSDTFLENVWEVSFFHRTSHCLFMSPCPDK